MKANFGTATTAEDFITGQQREQSERVVVMAKENGWGVKAEVTFQKTADLKKIDQEIAEVISMVGGFKLSPSWNEYCDVLVYTTPEGFDRLQKFNLFETVYATGCNDQIHTLGQKGGQLTLGLAQ